MSSFPLTLGRWQQYTSGGFCNAFAACDSYRGHYSFCGSKRQNLSWHSYWCLYFSMVLVQLTSSLDVRCVGPLFLYELLLPSKRNRMCLSGKCRKIRLRFVHSQMTPTALFTLCSWTREILWPVPLFGVFCGEKSILSMIHKHLWILLPTISFSLYSHCNNKHFGNSPRTQLK